MGGDFPLDCEQCIHYKQGEEHVVGPEESGGLKIFISCKKNRDILYYSYHSDIVTCPDFDDGIDERHR